ncbi:NAD(P)H-hydrate dehydratase [Aerococcus sp. UMB8487]|uniref:NAD(P)H-hydrate dehydratase n=1 Tax=Aerococcus sp. UMB8487 TaxID=3046346 RepID=UPI00254D42CD|nr:NAD(P)H-hydrate dehydratase [Aerococcus sp. UMB8487]MDK6939334.1 NAD(P)H-hydrate dehydratase [Aerococcus sp. UMB8487]
MQALKITEDQVVNWLPQRKQASYKGTYGRLLLIGGNQNMGGAIQMAGQAALAGGAGLITIATDPVNFPAIHASLPEVMLVDWSDVKQVQACLQSSEIILLGPGMGRSLNRWRQLSQAVYQEARTKPLIIDGDALTMLAADIQDGICRLEDFDQVILSPHPGEWARLYGSQPGMSDPGKVQAWCDHYQVYLVKKSEATQLYLPGQDTYYQNTCGNPGMAVGGSGDTLAGMIAAFIGQSQEDLAGALLSAVYCHSALADQIYQDHYVVRPSVIARHLAAFMRQLSLKKGV